MDLTLKQARSCLLADDFTISNFSKRHGFQRFVWYPIQRASNSLFIRMCIAIKSATPRTTMSLLDRRATTRLEQGSRPCLSLDLYRLTVSHLRSKVHPFVSNQGRRCRTSSSTLLRGSRSTVLPLQHCLLSTVPMKRRKSVGNTVAKIIITC